MKSNFATVYGIPVIESELAIDLDGNPTWYKWPPDKLMKHIPLEKRELKIIVHPKYLKDLLIYMEKKTEAGNEGGD